MVSHLPLAALSVDLISDFRQLTAYPFMVNALEAGTIVAVMAGVVGWFMVLRRETFAGHTLSVMAFPGATFALLLGLSAAVGYYTFCGACALVIGAAAAGTRRHRGEESAVTGTVQAFGLACGFLFLSLYQGVLAGYENLLFGDFLGITRGQVLTLAIVCVLALGFFAVVGRPLLFASVDEPVARASGVPVRALSLAFMLALGLTVAATAQITGALLVFALLVAPRRDRAADHPADRREPRPDGAARHRDHLGRARARLLLQLSRRLLHHRGRVLRLPDRPARSSGDRSSHPAARPLPRRPGARVMFAQEFVRNAWLAGTAIALASGLIGYFVVLRAQVFAGDALSHVAFTGALAAAAAGIDIRIGLFAATILIALLLGALGDRSHADDVTIGVTFAAILGLGVYFLALFSTGSGGGNGLLGARTLFGSIFGLSASRRPDRRADRRRDHRRRCSRSPGRCCSPASTPPSPPRAASRSARSGCCCSRCSAPPPPKRPRRSARCCCSGCSPRPPAPRNDSPPTPTTRSDCPPRSPCSAPGPG